MRSVKKILTDRKGKKYLVKELDDDFHTADGVISKKDLKSKKTEVKSNKGKKFVLLEPNFVDLWEMIKRGPQVVLQKDIGLMMAKTGINGQSKIVDAGGGSGSLCCSLANVSKEVTAYEVQKNLIEVLEYNKNLMGLNNLTIKNKSIYQGIAEKDLDVITLDLAEPWQVIKHAEKSLKLGGFLVVYLPNIIQVKQFVDSLRGSSIRLLEVEELLERKWKVEERILRPEYEMLGHTGFLVFCRKLS
ncbi:methyltransferase [Candidatus Woesearchaeota archaeon]|nr:methyltransferase [Candidatus Woesearchaeota archaeon]